MNLDTKKRLLADKELVVAHRDLVVSENFLRAAEAALVDSIMNTDDTDDPVVAAGAFHRIMGAKQFLKALLNIAETPTAPPRVPLPLNLNHHA